MFDIFLFFIIFCLLVVLGIVSGNYNHYKKKMRDIQTVYNGDWDKWSEVKVQEFGNFQDIDGSWVSTSYVNYQDRYHKITGEYERRNV